MRRSLRNEFTAIVERDGKWSIAYCPEIAGANGQGRMKAEARTSLADAIALIRKDSKVGEVDWGKPVGKFDRPFLIYVKKRGAPHPHFVMWVENAELLRDWTDEAPGQPSRQQPSAFQKTFTSSPVAARSLSAIAPSSSRDTGRQRGSAGARSRE